MFIYFRMSGKVCAPCAVRQYGMTSQSVLVVFVTESSTETVSPRVVCIHLQIWQHSLKLPPLLGGLVITVYVRKLPFDCRERGGGSRDRIIQY